MLLLFSVLLIRGRVSAELERTSTTLLSHLSLLFVPAGVGVIVYLDVLAMEWLPILVALVVGTAAPIVVVGLVLKVMIRDQDTQP